MGSRSRNSPPAHAFTSQIDSWRKKVPSKEVTNGGEQDALGPGIDCSFCARRPVRGAVVPLTEGRADTRRLTRPIGMTLIRVRLMPPTRIFVFQLRSERRLTRAARPRRHIAPGGGRRVRCGGRLCPVLPPARARAVDGIAPCGSVQRGGGQLSGRA